MQDREAEVSEKVKVEAEEEARDGDLEVEDPEEHVSALLAEKKLHIREGSHAPR